MRAAGPPLRPRAAPAARTLLLLCAAPSPKPELTINRLSLGEISLGEELQQRIRSAWEEGWQEE